MAFSNNAGLQLLSMLQHAPLATPVPDHQQQQAPLRQPPIQVQPSRSAPPTPAATSSLFSVSPEQGPNAGMHLMSLLGIQQQPIGSGQAAAPASKPQQQIPAQQKMHEEEDDEEQIVGGFFAKQKAAASIATGTASAPAPGNKNPTTAFFRRGSTEGRPTTGRAKLVTAGDGSSSTIRKVNERGPMARLAKGPDGTTGFHSGRKAAGLPVVHTGTASARSTSPPSPKRPDVQQHVNKGGSILMKNKKNDISNQHLGMNRSPLLQQNRSPLLQNNRSPLLQNSRPPPQSMHNNSNNNNGSFHRSPLKACGNIDWRGGGDWRASQPVFA